MRKRSVRIGIVSLIVMLCVAAGVVAPQREAGSAETKTAMLLTGFGQHTHPVATDNPTAQRFFNQGLALYFAFNHEEAMKSFIQAAALDPRMAMAYWGIALAIGNHPLLSAGPLQKREAHAALQKALALSQNGPQHERDYIEALAKRFSDEPHGDQRALERAYRSAMREVAAKYPDDPDAATLYAESIINQRPWRLWHADGAPAEGTEELIALLESVLRQDPYHIGANCLYIHAVEASPNPERALPNGVRLRILAPGAGHLAHLPAHIYLRAGFYQDAVRCNEAAIAADRNYLKARGKGSLYSIMNQGHILHSLSFAQMMQGRFSDAKKAADQLAAHVRPHIKEMPALEYLTTIPLFVLVKFGKWDAILHVQEPAHEMILARAVRHFSRGMAHAAKGDADSALAERKKFMQAVAMLSAESRIGVNASREVMKVAEAMLNARILFAKGDGPMAIEFAKRATIAEESLRYNEPPDWFLSPRVMLGSMLLAMGEFKEAEMAFRADLKKYPRNGPSLAGLSESLKRQGQHYAAGLVDDDFNKAWKYADTKLDSENF